MQRGTSGIAQTRHVLNHRHYDYEIRNRNQGTVRLHQRRTQARARMEGAK